MLDPGATGQEVALSRGLWLPPRLWAGGFPTGMKGAGRCLGAQYCHIFRIVGEGLWEGPLSGPEPLSLKNGGGALVIQRGRWMFISWSFVPLCVLSICMLSTVLH